jgi:hypothetical protein
MLGSTNKFKTVIMQIYWLPVALGNLLAEIGDIFITRVLFVSAQYF